MKEYEHGLTVDHIGYAVKNLDSSRAAFEALGFRFEEAVPDPGRNVMIQFGSKDSCRIELVAPLSQDQPSPVDGYLGKTGPTPYHLCYRAANLVQAVDFLRAQRFKVMIPPAGAPALGGRNVVFLCHREIGMIELVEEVREGASVCPDNSQDG